MKGGRAGPGVWFALQEGEVIRPGNGKFTARMFCLGTTHKFVLHLGEKKQVKKSV